MDTALVLRAQGGDEEAFMNLTTDAVEFASERSSQEGVAA